MPQPNSQELYLLIQAKSYIDEVLNKVKGQMQDLAGASNKASEQMAEGTKPVGEAFKKNLQTMAQLHRTVLRIGMVWGVTVGAMVKSMYDLRKEMENINRIAYLSGETVDSLSKKFYGFRYNVESVQNVTNAFSRLKDVLVSGLWMKTGEGIGTFVDALTTGATQFGLAMEKFLTAPIQPGQKSTVDNWRKAWEEAGIAAVQASRESTQAQRESLFQRGKDYETMIGQTKQLELNAFNYKKWIFTQTIEAYRRAGASRIDIDNLVHANTSLVDKTRLMEMRKMQAETARIQGNITEAEGLENQIRLQAFIDTYGVNGKMLQIYQDNFTARMEMERAHSVNFQTQTESWTEAVKTFSGSTKDFFYDTFVDAFDNNLSNAKEIFAGFLMSLRNSMLKYLSDVMVYKAFGGMFGTMMGIGGMATGGIVTKPTLSMVGEKEPEAVIPLSKLGNIGGEAQEVHNTYVISAIDPSSFANIVSRNPDCIVQVVDNAIRRNKGIRKTMRELT